MITKKTIKEIVKKQNKKISKKAYETLKKQMLLKIKEIIKDSSINADFEGRKIIKSIDIEKN